MKKIVSGIYIIFCKKTKECYIGCSTNIYPRLNTHRSHLKHNIHTNPKLQHMFNKYGLEEFEFELLEEYPKEVLTSMEHFWVTILECRKVGFNSRPTNPYEEIKSGRIFNKRVHSDETKNKIRQTLKGRKNMVHSNFMKGNKNRAKIVVAPNGITYESINDASKYYNVDRSTMRKIIKKYKESTL
jgi:group I intron endonuclease